MTIVLTYKDRDTNIAHINTLKNVYSFSFYDDTNVHGVYTIIYRVLGSDLLYHFSVSEIVDIDISK